jgi:hypothetical protein
MGTKVKFLVPAMIFNQRVEHNHGQVHGTAQVLQHCHNHHMSYTTVNDQFKILRILTAAKAPIGRQLSPRQFSQHIPLAGTNVQLHMVYHLPMAYTAFGSLTVPRCLWYTIAAYTLATRNAERYP